MHLRPYQPPDRPACLAIFDSNTPPFFDPGERSDFAEFLADVRWPYFVVERPGAGSVNEIVACGGYFVRPGTTEAILVWGMVRRDLHGGGIGTYLTRERLERLAQQGVASVRIVTSQYTRAFYERLGFAEQNLEPDGFGPGLHKYTLVLRLSN